MEEDARDRVSLFFRWIIMTTGPLQIIKHHNQIKHICSTYSVPRLHRYWCNSSPQKPTSWAPSLAPHCRLQNWGVEKDHTGNKRQSWDSHASCLTLESGLLIIRLYCLSAELSTTQMCLFPSLTKHMYHSSKAGNIQTVAARSWAISPTNRVLCFYAFAGNGAAAEKVLWEVGCMINIIMFTISASFLSLACREWCFLILEVKDHVVHSDQKKKKKKC